jgi:hypothetical protein
MEQKKLPDDEVRDTLEEPKTAPDDEVRDALVEAGEETPKSGVDGARCCCRMGVFMIARIVLRRDAS